ncbi:JAB domain-containing protein [Vibrio tasmaniensis]|nr:JAB domain-containing protein [Vibrio tasmaniensis]
MPISKMPAESMPREKLLSRGPDSLSDAELLAIFLRTGTQGMNVLELSDKLIKDFGSLRSLFSATEAEFCAHKGMGQAKYVQLQAVLEMTQRYLAETLSRGDALTSPSHTKLYLSSILRDRQREAFYILFLDNQNRVIKDEVMFEGTIDALALVDIRILDHFVVGDGEVISFAERGWI